jgi:hypothetical protein
VKQSCVGSFWITRPSSPIPIKRREEEEP